MFVRPSKYCQLSNLCWDEENRLAAVMDEQYMSHYIYNAGCERTWVLSGETEIIQQNGGGTTINVDLDKTLYSSPYMIFTENEYTKHYYVENQRLVTKIGGGFETRIHNPEDHIVPITNPNSIGCLSEDLYTNIYNKNLCLTEYDVSIVISPTILVLTQDCIDNNESEKVIYFFHSDHLGSSSFITDASGNADKHFQYLPFGENFISEQNSTFNTRYEFSGKEKDMATGYNYFGARYYNSDISVWLSVDPMSDARPGLSPYNYCQWNPVMLIDQTGMLDGHWLTKHGKDLGDDDEDDDNVYTIDDKEYSKTGRADAATLRKDYDNGNLNNTEKLKVTYTDFVKMRNWANNEIGAQDGWKSLYALNSAILNLSQGGPVKDYSVEKLTNLLSKLDNYNAGYAGIWSITHRSRKRIANAATINALSGGIDWSKGATQWDGIEQGCYFGGGEAYYYAKNGERWISKAYFYGWSINDEHYTKWSNSLNSQGFTFNAPKSQAAQVGVNSGKITYYSTACYGTTIFWKVIN